MIIFDIKYKYMFIMSDIFVRILNLFDRFAQF